MRKSLRHCFCLGLVILSTAGCRARKPAPHNEPAPAGPELKTSELSVTDRLFQNRLLRGFYDGSPQWKWTAREFAVLVDVPPPVNAPATLKLDFTVPHELLEQVKDVTVTASVNGTVVGKQQYSQEGRNEWTLPVPPGALQKDPATIEYSLDHWGKDASTGRDIGLIVVGVTMSHPDTTILDQASAVQTAQQGYARLLAQRKLDLPEEKQREMMKLFHQVPIWAHMWFQNVKIEKNPLDLWMMQQVIYETRPEFIVETGTAFGGSALYWAHTLNGMGLENSRVITMDIYDYCATAKTHPLWKKYVTFFKASSTDPAILSQIADRVKGHKTLVTLDSDHSMQHVLNELHVYSPMVSRGSYLIVEDTHIDGVPTQPNSGPGPLAAVLKYLKEGGDKMFEQDFSREAFIMTFNPGGWLKRK